MNGKLYFLRERYRGSISDGDTKRRLGPDSEKLSTELAASSYQEQSPDLFSQELFFLYNRPALIEYHSGRCKFPYYKHYGYDLLWKAIPGDTPYVDRMVERFPCLSLELVEVLARERARGVETLPLPAEPNARWKCASHIIEGINAIAGATSKYAIITPRLGIGGGEKFVRELRAALQELTDKPALMIVGDTEHEGGENVFALSSMRLDGQPFLTVPIPRRAEALRDVLICAGVKYLFNVNSFIANYAIQTELLAGCGIGIACAIFSVPILASGEIGGYVRDVDWLGPNVRAFFTDNEAMGRILREHFFADPVHVLTVPESVRDGPIPRGENVLWASRIDEEKRPDLLAEIATLMPERTFEVWGTPLLSDNRFMEQILSLPNVLYRGPFASFDEIDLQDIGCFLYTTRYEGKPNTVVEAMSRALVCIATDVGGVPELLGDDRGILIPPDADAHAYVSALREFFASETKRRRAEASRSFIRSVHTHANFRNGLKSLLDFISAAANTDESRKIG
jgi:glycosyltransferase involved in cell wall biosynthesis